MSHRARTCLIMCCPCHLIRDEAPLASLIASKYRLRENYAVCAGVLIHWASTTDILLYIQALPHHTQTGFLTLLLETFIDS